MKITSESRRVLLPFDVFDLRSLTLRRDPYFFSVIIFMVLGTTSIVSYLIKIELQPHKLPVYENNQLYIFMSMNHLLWSNLIAF